MLENSSPNPTNPRLPTHGFTLLELLIAVALFGVLAAMMTPVFRHSSKGDPLELTSQVLYNHLSKVRTQSISKNILIVIEPLGPQSLQCEGFASTSVNKVHPQPFVPYRPPTKGAQSGESLFREEWDFSLIEGIQMECTNISFYPNGTTTGCQILLSNEDKTITFSLEPRFGTFSLVRSQIHAPQN